MNKDKHEKLFGHIQNFINIFGPVLGLAVTIKFRKEVYDLLNPICSNEDSRIHNQLINKIKRELANPDEVS